MDSTNRQYSTSGDLFNRNCRLCSSEAGCSGKMVERSESFNPCKSFKWDILEHFFSESKTREKKAFINIQEFADKFTRLIE